MKVLKWGFRIFLILAAIVGMKAGSDFFPLLKGAVSVQKLDEGLYSMEFHGDDGFDGLLEQGGGRTSGEMVAYINGFLSGGHSKAPAPEPVSQDFGCSALTVTSPEGGALMGRNFDFASATGMIVHSYPKNGYESVSTFNTEFLGMGEGWLPEGFKNQYISLACLFFALDGINEKGLAVANLMAGDDVETHQDTGKPALTTTASIKYLLNKAATVEEALELLESIDMHSDIGSAHHLAISDASGRCVVVEYVDNRMVVVESPAVANHYLCEEKLNVGLKEWDHRYEQLCMRYDEAGGVMTMDGLTSAIESAVQEEHEGEFLGTAWTMLMDLQNPSVTYYSRRHFDNPFHFDLKCKSK